MKITEWGPGGSETLYHWCPACTRLHVIPAAGWTRTGEDDAPTYTPSFLQYPSEGDVRRCHYWITNGALQFLPDSWHQRNDVVPMPDIPQEVLDKLTDAIFNR